MNKILLLSACTLFFSSNLFAQSFSVQLDAQTITKSIYSSSNSKKESSVIIYGGQDISRDSVGSQTISGDQTSLVG
ncbi:MAG: hypothetical protein P4M12_06910 [Gammaproteobacteria bacterium]|nr:hypothetical protein [Gammaproteobacteria bacterium]